MTAARRPLCRGWDLGVAHRRAPGGHGPLGPGSAGFGSPLGVRATQFAPRRFGIRENRLASGGPQTPPASHKSCPQRPSALREPPAGRWRGGRRSRAPGMILDVDIYTLWVRSACLAEIARGPSSLLAEGLGPPDTQDSRGELAELPRPAPRSSQAPSPPPEVFLAGPGSDES